MERKLSIGKLKPIFVAIFFWAGFPCQGRFCLAAGSEPAGNAGQIEAKVIHVDEYAVYVPNLIFYFDTQMDKGRIETLKSVANQLRNKKALITYSSTGDLRKDKHLVLSDIVPPGQKPNLDKPAREAAKPPADRKGNRPRIFQRKKSVPIGDCLCRTSPEASRSTRRQSRVCKPDSLVRLQERKSALSYAVCFT